MYKLYLVVLQWLLLPCDLNVLTGSFNLMLFIILCSNFIYMLWLFSSKIMMKGLTLISITIDLTVNEILSMIL